MSNIEKEISKYIDRLNAERKPEAHGQPGGLTELEELCETVRLVRSLKEPALPEPGYEKKLAKNVAYQLFKKTKENPAAGKARKNPAAGTHTTRIHAQRAKSLPLIGAAAAVILVVAVLAGFILPFGRTNIVYAMEQAFQGIKAYHGLIEIIETNADGKASTQAKLEVWADKEGHYYVKEQEGAQKGLITANNGQKKWQVRPGQKQVYVFPAFPDPYRFTFEMGKEVDEVKNALETKVVGEETVAGRKASVLEVYPRGGVPYRIWIDKETSLPLQKESGMQNALQYKVTYTKIDFYDSIPAEMIVYKLPEGFEEIDTNPEQIVTSLEEAMGIVGFTPNMPENLPPGYDKESIAVNTGTKTVKLNFVADDGAKRVVVLESEPVDEFKPASTAVLGKVGGNIAEIQSPVQESLGIISGAGPYAGVTDTSSIRWRQDGLEYAVIGNASLEELALFVKGLANGTVDMPLSGTQPSMKPQVEVPVDLEIEENEQKSVDAGHSPWRLDPAFVAQVFVSLKISPEGITGDYPINYEDLKVTQNTGIDAVVEVSGDKTPIRRVYLKRLIRQDSTGIWSVVGYDPAEGK